jgi:hypothetical protein
VQGNSKFENRPSARRRLLGWALALAVLVVAIGPLTAGAEQNRGGGGVGTGSGGGGGAADPAFAGQGMWIWYLSASNHGKVRSIIRKAHHHGVRTLFIKSADGRNTWSQFTPRLVRKLHRAHLSVCGWQFVYGTKPKAEAVTAARAKRDGADCMIIDAESAYEGRYAAAVTYVKELRKLVGRHYPLGLAPFPYVDYHPSFPYSVFLGPGGAQQNLPQLYWHTIGTTVAAGYAHTYSYNRIYGRPIEPLGQTYDSPPSREVKLFRRYARAYRMPGLSWWDWQDTGPSSWKAIGARHLSRIHVDRSGLYPTLGHRATGDPVVWAQEHLNGAGYGVRVGGKLNRETSKALSKFQRRRGIHRTGILDPPTWKRLMKVRPKMVNWARRHDKRGAPAAPASADLPAVRNEIPDGLGSAR